MKEKIAIIVRGCPKNEVDAEVLAGELQDNDFNIVSEIDLADVIIIFTCAFIKNAVQESLETIFEVSLYNKRIIVTGCIVNRYGLNTLKELIPEVEIFFDTYNYLNIIPYLIKSNFKENKNFIYSHKNNRIIENSFAYVKISEGCSNSCSFCTIPKIKGKLFSRKIEDIYNEVKYLVEEKGVKEIILVSQNSGDYGRDLENGTNIVKLIKNLLKINTFFWVRLLYIYPQHVSDELLELSFNEKFCNYLDIPLQHIDNDILKKMGRSSTERSIKDTLDKIKSNYPKIFLRTSLIVGFPGETEEKFQKLLDFINEYKFYNLGCFKYSKEDGTKAAKLKEQIPEKIKNIRYKKIMSLQRKILENINRSLLSKKFKAIVEGVSDETELLLKSRCEFQAPDIDGITYINKGFVKEKGFYNIKITDFKDYDLIGEITTEQ
jgi:ribosomal protein S12 methylthiotransferase